MVELKTALLIDCLKIIILNNDCRTSCFSRISHSKRATRFQSSARNELRTFTEPETSRQAQQIV